ncbi:MAG: helix-turn-helix domain-containing protein [Phycisphaeraceae bacterium]|nr:helix-turn-helix domain-containing protein [Phycisphaeraceae bacterium]
MAKLAEFCGFGTPSHFSEYFSKHAGVSPSAFRKVNQRKV